MDKGRGRNASLSVLRHRNFRLYWTGQFISLAGSWMQQLAQSLVVLKLAHTAFALGELNFVAALPPALLLLHGGVVADKMDKRRILIVTQIMFMVGAFVMASVVRANIVQLWHVMAMAVLLGMAMAFDMPANQALVPELVERQDIPAAVQLNQAIFHGSRLIGPAMAGWLIGRYGMFSGFVANGLSFIPVILTLLVIRPIRQSEKKPQGNARESMREGFAYVRAHSDVGAMLGMTALTTSLIFPNMAVMIPFYVKDVLRLGAGELGTMMSASGLGAFLGAMSLLTVPDNRRYAHIALGLVGIVTGVLILAISPYWSLGYAGKVSLNLVVACAGSAVMSFSMSSALGMLATILQQMLPDELRGRVMSVQNLVFIGILPFSALIMTKLADLLTMQREMILAAALYAIGATLMFRRFVTHHSAKELQPVEISER